MPNVKRSLAHLWPFVSGAALLLVGFALLLVSAVERGYQSVTVAILGVAGTAAVTVGGILIGRATTISRSSVLPPFRRTFSLYGALGRYADLIEKKRVSLESGVDDGKIEWRIVDSTFELLAGKVEEQIQSSNDAASEWVSILPDEVRELTSKASPRARRRGAS